MSRPIAPADRCLRPAEWPAIDRTAWELVTQGDILDGVAVLAQLSPRTHKNYSDCYGHWLNHLATFDELEPDLPPALRVTPDRVRAYVQRLEAGSASATVAQRIYGLYRVISTLAPEHDWRWLARVASRLERKIRPTRAKRPLVRPSGELAAAGHALMAAAAATVGRRPVQQATLYRDGLMLALLAARPVRIANFTAIRIGRQLQRVGRGWQLVFEPEETKNGAGIELPFPTDLVAPLEVYLERWRPLLLGRGSSDRLWISARGNPLNANNVYIRICTATRRQLGRPLNPHLFRDCLATSIAIQDPVNIHAVAALLGHRTLATMEKYYN